MADEQGNVNQPDFAGYENLDGLVSGYRASSEEGKRQKARADEAERRARELEAYVAANQRPQGNDPRSQLEALGVPYEPIAALVNDLAEQKIRQQFEPLKQAVQARQSLLSRNPEYRKFEPDVDSFVNSDPELSQTYERMLRADPAGAMDWAFMKFGQSKAAEPRQPRERPSRAEAQLPTSRTGDARQQPSDNRDNVRAGQEHYQKTGNPVPFAKARLREVLSDDFLNGR